MIFFLYLFLFSKLIKTEFELKADVELVRKVFSKFDINSDGRIEAKELKTAMKELIGKEASDEEIAEMVFNKKSEYIYLVCYSIN